MVHLIAFGVNAGILSLWALVLSGALRISRPLFRIPYFLTLVFLVVISIIETDTLTPRDIEPLLTPPLVIWSLALVFFLPALTIYAARAVSPGSASRAAGWSPLSLIALTVAAALIAGGAIAYEIRASRNLWAHLRVEAERTQSNLAKVADIPDVEVNAAPLYIVAFDIGRTQNFEDISTYEPRSADWFDRRDIAHLVDADERAFHILMRSSRLQHCRFDEELKQRPTLHDVMYFVSLMYRASVLSGGPETQWAGVDMLHRFADHLRSGQLHDSYLIYDVEKQACCLAQQIIQFRHDTVVGLEPALLARDVDHSANVPATIVRWKQALLLRTSQAWLGERQIGHGWSEDRYNPAVGQCGPDFATGLRLELDRVRRSNSSLERLKCYRDDAEFALAETQRLVANGRLLTSMELAEVKAAVIERSPWTDGHRYEAIDDLLREWMGLNEAAARRRVTVTGLAVAAYRKRYGDYPDRLADLVPEFLPHVPTDPADGKPLRYWLGLRGAMVSSIGDDLVDDVIEILTDASADLHLSRDVCFLVPDDSPPIEKAAGRSWRRPPPTSSGTTRSARAHARESELHRRLAPRRP